jgi:hypothetical protein
MMSYQKSTAEGGDELGVALHIERRRFLHFMWRYRMEVRGSLSQFTLPKMNAEVSVRA